MTLPIGTQLTYTAPPEITPQQPDDLLSWHSALLNLRAERIAALAPLMGLSLPALGSDEFWLAIHQLRYYTTQLPPEIRDASQFWLLRRGVYLSPVSSFGQESTMSYIRRSG